VPPDVAGSFSASAAWIATSGVSSRAVTIVTDRKLLFARPQVLSAARVSCW